MFVVTDGNSECALLKLFDRNGNLLQSLHLKLPVTESNTYHFVTGNNRHSFRSSQQRVLIDLEVQSERLLQENRISV